MKPLTDLAVLQAAETLMNQNGQTTTLDVKNLLRQQTYEATQAEVSSRMDNVARQEHWQINSAGAYKIYKLPPDTDQTLESYWENPALQQFWQIKATHKTIQINEGSIDQDGTFQNLAYPTNRETIREAQKRIQEKKNDGFQQATDQRLPIDIRQHFAQYLSKKPLKIITSYFGVRSTRQREGIIQVDDQKIQGVQIENTSGGYEYTWELPTEALTIQDFWNKPYTLTPKTPSASLGEKTTTTYQNLQWEYIKGKMSEPQAWTQAITSIYPDNLFQVKVFFDDNSMLQFGRYDSLFAEKHNPRKTSPNFWKMALRFVK